MKASSRSALQIRLLQDLPKIKLSSIDGARMHPCPPSVVALRCVRVTRRYVFYFGVLN